MNLGIMAVLMNTFMFTTNKSLKAYLQEDFIERLEEPDIQTHFRNNHVYYDRVKNIIQDVSARQKIDEFLQ